MEKYELKNIQLGEVKLRVNNMYQSLDFYKKVLGLKVLELGRGSVKLTADGVKSLIEIEEIPKAIIPEPQSRIGLYHVALLLPTRKDLGLLFKNLMKLNVPFEQADHLVSEAIYISDPDNNGIEISYDRPRECWKYDENNEVVMATDFLAVEDVLAEVGEDSFIGLSTETVIGHLHLHVGNLEIHLLEHSVKVKGKSLDLTLKEFRLLSILAQEPGKVWSKFKLLDLVWQINLELESNVVEATIRNVRRKMEALGSTAKIESKRHLGYWLEA